MFYRIASTLSRSLFGGTSDYLSSGASTTSRAEASQNDHGRLAKPDPPENRYRLCYIRTAEPLVVRKKLVAGGIA